jgi:hypothetical protein
MVSLQTQPKLDHLLTITHHQLTNMGTYQPYVRSKHSETNYGTITNTSELLISGRLLMPLCLPLYQFCLLILAVDLRSEESA